MEHMSSVIDDIRDDVILIDASHSMYLVEVIWILDCKIIRTLVLIYIPLMQSSRNKSVYGNKWFIFRELHINRVPI